MSWKTKCVKANSFLSTKLYTSPWNPVINIFNLYFVFICSGNLASTRPDFTLRYSTWCRFLTCNNLIATFVNNIILLVKRFKLFNLAEILFNLYVGVNCALYKRWIFPLHKLFLGYILIICYQLLIIIWIIWIQFVNSFSSLRKIRLYQANNFSSILLPNSIRLWSFVAR